MVNCVLKDGDKDLDTREITRVGYNCEAGERGVGKDCEVCETGQTSRAGVGDCFAGNSSCLEGYWGIEENCQPCPDKTTSSPQAVKFQECFPDVSYCKEGQYGYGYDCSLCPGGETTKPHTKKETGCFIPTDLTIPIVGGAGGLAAVLVFGVIFCLVLRRRKAQNSQVVKSMKTTLVGSADIDAVSSGDTVQQNIPSIPYDIELENPECLYSVVNKKCANQDSDKEMHSQVQSDSPDVTYAAVIKANQTKTTSKAMNQEPKTTKCSEDSLKMVSLEVSEDMTYAKLGEVNGFHCTDDEKIGNEESACSCLERSESVIGARGLEKKESHISAFELDGDPLYADMADR